jgi:hypothetical protein
MTNLTLLTYRCRDIGYGVEEGTIEGRWTGERDTSGKRTFEPAFQGGKAPLYLFDDEVITEEPVFISGAAVIATARANGGFLTEDQIGAIASDPDTRLQLLLVRCGSGRFIAPAQDAGWFIRIIEEHAKQNSSNRCDYVRDISLPAIHTQAVRA